MSRRALTWMVMGVVLALLIAGATACVGEAANDTSGSQGEEVSGFIVDVKSKSLSEIASLTIEDENGKSWRFDSQATRDVGFAPSHLRQHMVLGVAITVWYHRKDGALVIDRMADRDPS